MRVPLSASSVPRSQLYSGPGHGRLGGRWQHPLCSQRSPSLAFTSQAVNFSPQFQRPRFPLSLRRGRKAESGSSHRTAPHRLLWSGLRAKPSRAPSCFCHASLVCLTCVRAPASDLFINSYLRFFPPLSLSLSLLKRSGRVPLPTPSCPPPPPPLCHLNTTPSGDCFRPSPLSL